MALWLWLFADIQHMWRPTQKALQIWNVCHSQSCTKLCSCIYSLNIFSYLIMLSATNQHSQFILRNIPQISSKSLCKICLSLHLKYFIKWCHIRTCMCVFTYVTHWITLLAWSCIFL